MPKRKILVVEDEIIIAKDIQKTLEKFGYAVPAIAPTGEEAIKKAQELKPDLVLMDIKLRGSMDGIEAAERIKNHNSIPIVYLTAHADDSTVKRAKITEPFGYLTKPFNANELRTTIEVAIYRHQIESKLVHSESKYRDLYENAPDGYLSVDAEGKIMDANKTWIQMLGYSKNEVIGKNVEEFIVADGANGFKAELPKLLREGFITNIECRIAKKNGNSLPVLINASAIYHEDGKHWMSRLVARDISSLKKLEKEKDFLTEKIDKLTKKLSLTGNESAVFHGLVRLPAYNDVQLSRLLNIKRSTITAIKNKLKREKYYSSCRFPKFSALGLELLVVVYAKLNPIAQYSSKKSGVFEEMNKIPEQVFFTATSRELLGIYLSKNFTDFKKQVENLLNQFREDNFIESTDIGYFPLEISEIENFFDFSNFLKKMLGLKADKEPLRSPHKLERELTNNEKIILYAMAKFPDMNDSEIAQATKIPRPSISQARRRLMKDNTLNAMNIPNIAQLKCELMSLNHFVFDSRIPSHTIENLFSHISNSASMIFMVKSGHEVCTINLYKDLPDYESDAKDDIKFLNENKISLKSQVSSVFPINQIENHVVSFAPLIKKAFGLKTNF